MNKSLFTIDPSEKQRILEMHQSATKKQYLGEQSVPTQSATTQSATTQVKSSVIGGVTIPGFLFAEDDAEWLATNNKNTGNKVTQQMYRDENLRRIYDYYGVTSGSLDPNSILNKYMIAFNSSNDYGVEKQNVYPQTFLIGKVNRSDKTKFVFIGPSDGFAKLHVKITDGKNGNFSLPAYAGDPNGAKVFNNVFNRLPSYFDGKSYQDLDPKFKFSK